MSGMYSRNFTAVPLEPGTRLNGIFEIEQRIASGGLGEVYRGRAIETGDAIAVKNYADRPCRQRNSAYRTVS